MMPSFYFADHSTGFCKFKYHLGLICAILPTILRKSEKGKWIHKNSPYKTYFRITPALASTSFPNTNLRPFPEHLPSPFKLMYVDPSCYAIFPLPQTLLLLLIIFQFFPFFDICCVNMLTFVFLNLQMEHLLTLLNLQT